jgi:hypothetical protein
MGAEADQKGGRTISRNLTILSRLPSSNTPKMDLILGARTAISNTAGPAPFRVTVTCHLAGSARAASVRAFLSSGIVTPLKTIAPMLDRLYISPRDTLMTGQF